MTYVNDDDISSLYDHDDDEMHVVNSKRTIFNSFMHFYLRGQNSCHARTEVKIDMKNERILETNINLSVNLHTTYFLPLFLFLSRNFMSITFPSHEYLSLSRFCAYCQIIKKYFLVFWEREKKIYWKKKFTAKRFVEFKWRRKKEMQNELWANLLIMIRKKWINFIFYFTLYVKTFSNKYLQIRKRREKKIPSISTISLSLSPTPCSLSLTVKYLFHLKKKDL